VKQATRFSVQPGWKVFITDLGVNPAHVLRFAGLPADLFARKDARMTPAEYFRLWRGLELAAGADVLPLKIGQQLSVEAFDPPIFASLCSANLNTALQRLAQFKQLVGPLTMLVEISAHQTGVTLDCYGNDEPIPHSLGAAELVLFDATRTIGHAQAHRAASGRVGGAPERERTVSGILRRAAVTRLGQPPDLFCRGC